MAKELKVSGRMTVKTLKSQFKENYGSTLRVYNGIKFADESATLASIRTGDAKGGELTVGGNMKVGNFEDKMKEIFGIKVQVANVDDSALADNGITLVAAGK